MPFYLVLFAFISCTSDEPSKADPSDGLSQDSASNNSVDGDIIAVDNWCEAAWGAEEGTRSIAADFSRAHVGQRIFGPSADWLGADESLMALLDDGIDLPLLDSYAESFEDICALSAHSVTETAGSLELLESVAVVIPGSDVVSIPSGVDQVIIDIRSPVDYDVFSSFVSLVLDEDIQIGERQLRRFLGFPSQEEGWTHYESGNQKVDLLVEGNAEQSYALHFLVGAQLEPKIATVVAGLRLAGQASILGHPVHTRVAESTWSGISSRGLLWRYSVLYAENEPWPDVVPADLAISQVENHLGDIQSLFPLSEVVGGVEREMMAVYNREAGQPPAMLSNNTMQAALLVAYGTLDWFYPYFDLVGREIDEALDEELLVIEGLSQGDREGMMHSLGRMMHDIYDGHGFYSDYGSDSWPDGWMAIQIQQVDGAALIRDSAHDGLEAGDEIIEVDGVPVAEWYEEAMLRYSASSQGYRFVLASDELKEIHASKELVLRDPQGVERTETIIPGSWSDLDLVAWGGSLRESGWLDELDAPTLYYVNMSASVMPDMEDVTDDFESVMSADGVILDMRDYPYLDIYEFARRFNPDSFTAPHFGFPTWSGPENYNMEWDIWSFSSASLVYTGPIVLMVSNKSVSAAECFAQMVYGLDNVTVVGQTSASTNGTITNAWLPGSFLITFTGMNLVNLDGSDFHGIGVVPDIEVIPTAEEFAQGIDPELMVAIEQLQPE